MNAQEVLDRLFEQLEGLPGLRLETSIRLRPGRVDLDGRFGCWLDNPTVQSTQRFVALLSRLGAPEAVLKEPTAVDPALCTSHGVAVSASESALDLRYYRHARDPRTLADDYQALRWRAGRPEVEFRRYRFHYMPQTPQGTRPIELVPGSLVSALSRLLAEPMFVAASGFWLRETPEGQFDQLDLAFPWYPSASSLEGLSELADLLELPGGGDWRHLNIRHLAIRLGRPEPEITLYSSAALRGDWPRTEREMQAAIAHGAATLHRQIDRDLLSHLPAATVESQGDQSPAAQAVEVGAFYDGDIAMWRQVLGAGMHYHAGIFDESTVDPDEDAMVEAQRRSVVELFPFIPAGGRLYDVGCGWGGPLGMFVGELGCPALGLTVSPEQFRHIASLGLPVRLGDAQTTLPPGRFDCAVLIESLCHMLDKERVLRILRLYCDRLVMRVNCQDNAPSSVNFGGTMPMISSSELRNLLSRTGWTVRHWRDRRMETLASFAGWNRALRDLPPTGHRHVEFLRQWSAGKGSVAEEWGRNNPLIEVMAQ